MLKSLVARSFFFTKVVRTRGEKHCKTGPSRGRKKKTYYNTGRRAARLCWKERKKKFTNIENYNSAGARPAL